MSSLNVHKIELPLDHLHFLCFVQLVRLQLKHMDLVKTKVARSIVRVSEVHGFGLLNPLGLFAYNMHSSSLVDVMRFNPTYQYVLSKNMRHLY